MHGDEAMANIFQNKIYYLLGIGKKETTQNNVVKINEMVLDNINKHISKNPFEYYPICELANVNKWYSTEWAKLQEELKTPIYYPPDFVHRKTWEWIQLIYGLEKLGVLNETATGLGVGAGHESPMYYFSNKVRKVIATDLYDKTSIWMTNAKEGDPEILTSIDKFAPFPYRKDRLDIKRMDGRNLEFPDNTFDFIQHFFIKFYPIFPNCFFFPYFCSI